jgi:hypothetical protein
LLSVGLAQGQQAGRVQPSAPQGFHLMDFSSPRASDETGTLFDLIPHPKHVFEKVRAAAERTTEVAQAACTTTFDAAAALNVELIEAGRSNLNATLEFARMAIAVRSPLELPALMNACARKQLELWVAQTRGFSNLAQKVAHAAADNGSGKTFKEAA